MHKAIAMVLSVGPLTLAVPAMAEYPALGWLQQPIDSSIAGCLNRAEGTMRQAGLQEVARSDNNISGHTQATSVAIVCNSAGDKTVLTIMVAGQDSIEAQKLQDSLGEQFDVR